MYAKENYIPKFAFLYVYAVHGCILYFIEPLNHEPTFEYIFLLINNNKLCNKTNHDFFFHS